MWRRSAAWLFVVGLLLLTTTTTVQALGCEQFKTCSECAGHKLENGGTCFYHYREVKIGGYVLKRDPRCDANDGVSLQSTDDEQQERLFKAESCPKEVVLGDQKTLNDRTANAKPCDIGFGIFSAEHLQHLVSASFPETHLLGSLLPRFISGDCTPDQMSIKMGEIAKLLSTIHTWSEKDFKNVPENEEAESDALELFTVVSAKVNDLSPIDLNTASEPGAWKTKVENMKEKLKGVLSPSKLADMMESAVDSLASATMAGLSFFVPSLKKVIRQDIKPQTPTGVFKGLTYGHLWRSYQRYTKVAVDVNQLPLPTPTDLNQLVAGSRTMASFDVMDFDDNLVVSLTLDVANLLTGGISGAVKTAIDSAVFIAKLDSMVDHEKNIQRRSDYIVNMLMSYDEQFRFGTAATANGLFKPHYSPYMQSNHYNFRRTPCRQIDRYCFYLGGIVRARSEAQKNEDYCICLKIDLKTSKAGLTKKGEKCAFDSDCQLGLLCQESLCKPAPLSKPVVPAVTEQLTSKSCTWDQLLQCDKALVEVDKTIWREKNEESKKARWCARDMQERCLEYTQCLLMKSFDDPLINRRRTASCIHASRRCFHRKLKLVEVITNLPSPTDSDAQAAQGASLTDLECEEDCQTQVQEQCPVGCLEPLRFLYFSRMHVGPGGSEKVVVSDFMRKGADAAHTVRHIHSVLDALGGTERTTTGGKSLLWPFRGGGRTLAQVAVTVKDCKKEADSAGDWYASV